MKPQERRNIANHRKLDSLFNSLLGTNSYNKQKHQGSELLTFCEGIPPLRNYTEENTHRPFVFLFLWPYCKSDSKALRVAQQFRPYLIKCSGINSENWKPKRVMSCDDNNHAIDEPYRRQTAEWYLKTSLLVDIYQSLSCGTCIFVFYILCPYVVMVQLTPTVLVLTM